MADREKVYAGLTACGKQACGDCPYDLPDTMYCNRRQLHDDALALLREHEARVMTREEIRSGAIEVAWIEDADKAEVIA